jgi:glycosyltransferase involved in cell wall biosynthesis
VVAAKVSGSDEQLGDAAILVDPKYPEEIAQAILKLYDDEELRIQLIQKGYSRANQWMGKDFIRGLFSLLDDFEHIRKCWDR